MAHISAGARTAISVIVDDIRKKTEPIFRKHVIMGALREAGRITYGHGSHTMAWRPRIKRRKLVPGIGNVTETTFPQTQTKIKCELPWRSYEMGESTTKFERLASQDPKTAIFNITEDVVTEMSQDFVENFNAELFVDGNAAATNKQIHGLESIFGNTGAVITDSVAANPSDTYAGHNTALGDLGGDWTADDSNGWPTGTGDTEYCAFSPLMVDYNSTIFGGTATNFDYQWRQAVNYVMTYGAVLQQADYDLLLLNPELLRRAKDTLNDNERFIATPKSMLTDLGFKTLSYEGLELATSYGVPSGVGYFLRWGAMELRSMQSQLVMPSDDFDIVTSERLHKLDCYLNLRIETPAYLAKLLAIATAGT